MSILLNSLLRGQEWAQCRSRRPARWVGAPQVPCPPLHVGLSLSWWGSPSLPSFLPARTLPPAYLPYMQSTSRAMPGWMKHKLKSRLLGEINNLRYADDTTLVAKSEEELKSLLMEVKEESEKAGLKRNIQKTKTMASSPITL